MSDIWDKVESLKSRGINIEFDGWSQRWRFYEVGEDRYPDNHPARSLAANIIAAEEYLAKRDRDARAHIEFLKAKRARIRRLNAARKAARDRYEAKGV